MIRRTNKLNAMKNILVLLFGCGISFLIVEIYSRIYLDTDPYLWKTDEKTGYRFVPNAAGRYHGLNLNLNSKGIRDYEYPYSRKPGVYRIAVLGDSFTFGLGVKNLADVYPKIVEKKLRDKSYQVEIINLGVGGYDTIQEIIFFKSEGIKYKPDLVMLGFVPNDSDPPLVNITLQNRLRHYNLLGAKEFVRRHFYSATYTIYMLRKITSIYGKPKSIEISSYRNCIDNIVSFSNYLRAHNISLIVFLLPYIKNLDDYPYHEAHFYIKESLDKNNIACYDLYPFLKNYDEKNLWLDEKDPHPNEKGHMLIADFLYIKLVDFLKDKI